MPSKALGPTLSCSSTCASVGTHKGCNCGAKKGQLRKDTHADQTLARGMQYLNLSEAPEQASASANRGLEKVVQELTAHQAATSEQQRQVMDRLQQEIAKRLAAEQALEAAVRESQQALAANRGLEKVVQELTAHQAATSEQQRQVMDRLQQEIAKRLAAEQALEAAVRESQQALAANRGLEQALEELTARQAAASDQALEELTARQDAASLEHSRVMETLRDEIAKRLEAERALEAAVRARVAPTLAPAVARAAPQTLHVWTVEPGMTIEMKYTKGLLSCGYVRFYCPKELGIITNSDKRLHFGIKAEDHERYGNDERAASAICVYFKKRLAELANEDDEPPPENGSRVAAALRRLSDSDMWKSTMVKPFRVITRCLPLVPEWTT